MKVLTSRTGRKGQGATMKGVHAGDAAEGGFTATYMLLPEYVNCPNCGFTIEFDEYWRSETFRCLFCGQTFYFTGSAVH